MLKGADKARAQKLSGTATIVSAWIKPASPQKSNEKVVARRVAGASLLDRFPVADSDFAGAGAKLDPQVEPAGIVGGAG